MTVWWLTLTFSFLLAALARKYEVPVTVDGVKKYKPDKVIYTLSCGLLVIVAGLRSGVGDTGTYRASFEKNTSDTFWDFLGNTDFQGDWGFGLLSSVIKQFFGNDSQVFLFICSLITIGLICIVLYKYCGLLELGIFTFITAGNYLVTMNGIRQYIGSAILFISFPLIYSKKWYFYFPLVYIASTMHSSALIFIPLYFIVNRPAWGKVTKGMLFAGILVFAFYPFFGPLIVDFIEGTQYYVYGTDLLSGEGGSNIIRSLVYAVPVIWSFIGRKTLIEKEKYANIVVNMSILNLISMLLATKYWIFARLCIYFSLFTIILFCWCIEHLLRKDEWAVYYIYLVLFGIYYWYEMVISLGQVYTSNYIGI